MNTIKYLVYRGEKLVGSFKSLELGIAQIERTCLEWNWDVSQYMIKDIVTEKILWKGSLINGSGTKVSIDS